MAKENSLEVGKGMGEGEEGAMGNICTSVNIENF